MTRAETGEARFPILSGLSNANYLYELAVVAVSYFALTEAALVATRTQCSLNTVVAADGRRAQPCPATGQSSLTCDSRRIILRHCHFSWSDDAFQIGFNCGRDHGRSALWSLAHQSLGARSG